MAFQTALDTFHDSLRSVPWAQELAGILPLSFLIDFIETPPKLHILQLAGTVPGWSWVITPSSGRLLLSQDGNRDDCCQDVFGATQPLKILDGRYGERYFASNPETFRLILRAHKVYRIENEHENMVTDEFEQRFQDVELVYISCATTTTDKDDECKTSPRPSSSWVYTLFLQWKDMAPRYTAASCLGWILFLDLATASALLELWLALAFFGLIYTTGLVVGCMHGSQTRQLLERATGFAPRLLIVTEHMNTSRWMVILGQSTLINCLMNRPLKRHGPSLSQPGRAALQHVLRLCILGQWAIAIAAATNKGWSSYVITFWQCFTIVSHAFLLTPAQSARDWATRNANIKIRRFSTRVSSRRSLLNTVVALNPDTLNPCKTQHQHEKLPDDGAGTPVQKSPELSRSAMSWINPILATCDDRSRWEKATQEALLEYREMEQRPQDGARQLPDGFPSEAWHQEYGRNYWAKFIPEGIYLANAISSVASASVEE